MTNVNIVIANKVRGVAAEKRFNQKHVAEALTLSRTSVADRYSGRIPFTGPELMRLAVTFDVPIERLFPEVLNVTNMEAAS